MLREVTHSCTAVLVLVSAACLNAPRGYVGLGPTVHEGIEFVGLSLTVVVGGSSQNEF